MEPNGPLPQHNDEEFVRIYREQRKPFFRWAKKWQTFSKEDLEDVYQDAIIVFYQHSISGKFDPQLSAPTTYLFSIGKNLMLKRNKSKRTEFTASLPEIADDNFTLESSQAKEHDKFLTQMMMKQLSGACFKVLTLFFFYRYQSDEVASQLGMSGPASARTRKNQCLKTLRDKFIKKIEV